MAQGLDQIATALQFQGGGVLQDPITAKVEPFPHPDAAPDIEGKAEVMGLAWCGGCGQAEQIGMQISHIAGRHMRIGGVGKGGVIMLPLRGNATQERITKVGYGPRANSSDGVGRNIGRVERAEGRSKALTACKDGAVGFFGAGSDVT